jgi:hypothetical protein
MIILESKKQRKNFLSKGLQTISGSPMDGPDATPRPT